MIGLVVNIIMYFVAKFEFYSVIKEDFIWIFPEKKSDTQQCMTLTYVNVHDQLPYQARKVVIRDYSGPCVSQQILYLIFEPQGHHVRCIIKRFNQHFSKIELTLAKRNERKNQFKSLN